MIRFSIRYWENWKRINEIKTPLPIKFCDSFASDFAINFCHDMHLSLAKYTDYWLAVSVSIR